MLTYLDGMSVQLLLNRMALFWNVILDNEKKKSIRCVLSKMRTHWPTRNVSPTAARLRISRFQRRRVLAQIFRSSHGSHGSRV